MNSSFIFCLVNYKKKLATYKIPRPLTTINSLFILNTATFCSHGIH